MISHKVVWRGSPSQWVNATVFCGVFFILLAAFGLEAAGFFDALFEQYLTSLAPFQALVKTAIFVFPIFVGIWRWLEVKFHTYELTEEVFRENVGVLNRETHELELYRVNDTMTAKPFEMNIMKLGHVILYTTDASDPEVWIIAIKDPDNVRQMIRHYVEIMRARKGIVEVANRG